MYGWSPEFLCMQQPHKGSKGNGAKEDYSLRNVDRWPRILHGKSLWPFNNTSPPQPFRLFAQASSASWHDHHYLLRHHHHLFNQVFIWKEQSFSGLCLGKYSVYSLQARKERGHPSTDSPSYQGAERCWRSDVTVTRTKNLMAAHCIFGESITLGLSRKKYID